MVKHGDAHVGLPGKVVVRGYVNVEILRLCHYAHSTMELVVCSSTLGSACFLAFVCLNFRVLGCSSTFISLVVHFYCIGFVWADNAYMYHYAPNHISGQYFTVISIAWGEMEHLKPSRSVTLPW